MKILFTLLFLFLCSSSFANLDSCVTGSYTHTGFNMYAELTLNDDNTFINSIQVASCTQEGWEEERFVGTYKIKDNLILFYPSHFIKIDTYDKDSTAFVYDKSIHVFRDTLFIVQDNVATYLLSIENIDLWNMKHKTNDFLHFVNDTNADYPTHNRFQYLRRINSCVFTEKSVKEQLPIIWQEYILPSFVEAKIIKIEEAEKDTTNHFDFSSVETEIDSTSIEFDFEPWSGDLDTFGSHEKDTNSYQDIIITIDKGRKDGLRKGMIFHDEEIYWDMEVIEVGENTSIIKPEVSVIENSIQIGKKVTTKGKQRR